ncbi:hypothetical protein CUU64_09205 [Bacillus sp. V5-8f]|nr:hypothetical protein CUU64_09205 [Bacillus sp. V5-8f]
MLFWDMENGILEDGKPCKCLHFQWLVLLAGRKKAVRGHVLFFTFNKRTSFIKIEFSRDGKHDYILKFYKYYIKGKS